MQLIPKATNWRRGILLYRRIRYRKGHGVHSPFAFNLITKVIEERCPYYRFQEIEGVRAQLLERPEQLSYPDIRHQGKLRRSTVGRIVSAEAISRKQGTLLFRLTNYFKPTNIVQLGSSMGLSTLYLSSYATGLNCVALECIPQFAAIAGGVLRDTSLNPIDLRVGDYQALLPQVLGEMGRVDFVFFNTQREPHENLRLFEACMAHVHNESFFVFQGIKSNARMRDLWKTIVAHPQVTVTVDMYSLGIVFFNTKLHKRNYIVYF